MAATSPHDDDSPAEQVDYLSNEWIAAADAAVADLAPLDEAVTVGFIIREVSSYSLVLGPGSVGVKPGVDRAGVTLTLDQSTASAIAQGELSAQRAFLEGVMTIGGDISLMLGHSDALGAIDDRLGELRAVTRFG